MSMPRWMVMGAAVAGISSVLWSAAMPSTDANNPEHATPQQLKERRFVQERQERELRSKMRDGVNADLAERNRPAEVRDAADDIARKLLRKAP